MILLYMRTPRRHSALRLGPRSASDRLARRARADRGFIPEATELAERVAEKIDGVPVSCHRDGAGHPLDRAHPRRRCMGRPRRRRHRRHTGLRLPGLYVVDGSAVSANPGVNPSLTITALAERAMSFVPPSRRMRRAGPRQDTCEGSRRCSMMAWAVAERRTTATTRACDDWLTRGPGPLPGVGDSGTPPPWSAGPKTGLFFRDYLGCRPSPAPR